MFNKILLINLLFFYLSFTVSNAQNVLITSENDRKIFFIEGNFDDNAADRAKSYCKSYNLNTYFFRSKDKETFDVQIKKRIIRKNLYTWRFFCAVNFDEAQKKFDSELFGSKFNSELKKINSSLIEGRFWETRVEPKKDLNINNNKSKAINKNDSGSTWGTIFTLVIIAYITWYFVRPNRKKKILKSTPKKEKPIKKTKVDLIQEWRDNR